MPEAVTAWIGEAVLEYLGEAVFAAFVDAAIAAPYVLAAASIYNLREQQRQAQNRAKDAYNASLRDRYVMQRTATQQRGMVLGRARVSGPMAFTRSFGPSKANLVMIVALAAHECDGIETVYFNDDALVLDGAGNVLSTLKAERFSIAAASATYVLAEAVAPGTVTAVVTYDTGDVTCGVSVAGDNQTVVITGASSTKIGALVVSYQPAVNLYSQETSTTTSASAVVTANSSGAGGYGAPVSLIPASATATTVGSNGRDVALAVTVSGNVINYTGAAPGGTVTIAYQYVASSPSRARVRKYLGEPGQAADARLISLLPDYWTSAHRGDGICYLICEFDYDPDSFPGGLPNVSAVVRGLKCNDPRTGLTAWSTNPALLMRAFWLHPLGANRSASEVDDNAIIAAANACDTSVTYTVGNKKSTRRLYEASTAYAKGTRAQDALNDLAQAMGGRWVVINNTLRVRAGSYATPVAAMDERWLHDGSAVQIQPRRNRADLANATVGTFADATHDWQAVNYPKVAPAAYATADGRELSADVHYPAVTFSGQCQFLSQASLRYARAGLTIKISCNMRAYPLEVFDVVTLSLARFGWSSKTFEVLETSFTVDGLIDLTLKEIDASIWTLDATFSATDYALKTTLPSPWLAEVPVLGTPASGTAYLQRLGDGTIISRIYATWSAITSPNVLNGGFIEVQWQRVGDTTGAWQSLTVPGDATGAYLTNVVDGKAYLIRARSRTRLTTGNWSTQVQHVVVGKTAPPSDVAGLSAVVVPGAVRITWTLPTDLDYDYTVLRYGSSWASGTTLPFNRPGTSYDWLWPTSGSYTVWAAHVDTSGNFSAVPQSVGIVVDSSIYIAYGSVGGRPKTYRVASQGLSSSGAPLGASLQDADATSVVVGAAAMYRVVKIHRTNKDSAGNPVVTDLGGYNPLSGALGPLGECNAMAAALNTIDPLHICVVFTYDEPRSNRMLGDLPAAMYRNGASQTVWGSPQFRYRGAYILIGIGGCGEGNGAEVYAGAVDSDANAWCDTTFQITASGAFVVSGANRGATTLLDYGYTGALDATRNKVYRQEGDPAVSPGGVVDFERWQVPSTGKEYARVAGVWLPVVGNGSIDTTQLANNAATEVTTFAFADIVFSNIT